MPTIRKAMKRDEAAILEWETLVGIVTYAAQDIKRAVEDRDYARFRVESADMRTALDELQSRLDSEAVICSVCERVIPADPRGDVLDSSGRCDECRP